MPWIPRFAPRAALLFAWLPAGAALAYGEPGELPPSFEERALHFFTDRVRVDPDFTDPEFEALPPVRPLVFNEELHEAARFYADDMAENGCFPATHASCDGTSFEDRVRSFYSGNAIGENIARGQPDAEYVVMDSWLYSDGHRANMLNGDFNEFGPGVAPESALWVQDFGARDGIGEPFITSATHWPLVGRADDTLTFFAAWFDPAGAPPTEVQLVSVGQCTELRLDRGEDGMATFVGEAPTFEEGCMPYWYFAVNEAGEELSYPSTGSLLAPIGDAECAPYSPNRSGAECAPSELGGFSGTGGGCGGTGEEYGPDANVGQDYEYGTCQLGAVRAPRGAWVLGLLLLGLRRRR